LEMPGAASEMSGAAVLSSKELSGVARGASIFASSDLCRFGRRSLSPP
jgi:hypothetical protein